MLQPNHIYIRITGHNGLEVDEEVEVGYKPIVDPSDEALAMGIYKFDAHGLYFRMPDIAKGYAYKELGDAYRETLAVMQLASLSGFERGCLKKKEPQDKKRAEKEDRIFWDAFKTWKTD